MIQAKTVSSKLIDEYGKVPHMGSFDLIVAGGGVAGVATALAARRAGRSVLLIEKSMMLGGLATLGLVNLFVPMCNGRGKQIIFGMAEELLRLSAKYSYDTIPDEWKDGEPSEPTEKRYINRFSPNIFALTLLESLVEEGVELLFDSVVSKPVMEGTRCKGLIVENKSGREYYEGKITADMTGDSDILFRAGIPTMQGRNYFIYSTKAITIESCKKAAESGKINAAFTGRSGGGANLYGKNHPEGMKFFKGTDAQDVTEFLIKNQIRLLENIKKEDRFSRDIVTLPGMMQYRTTRCLQGDYILKEEDRYVHFDDSISAICDFERRDFLYEVPLRCLCRKGFDNIITAGRSASGIGYGWDLLRVIPPAIVTGQAAGIAASLAIESGKPVSDVDIKTLQSDLSAAGIMVHFPDELIPEGAPIGGTAASGSNKSLVRKLGDEIPEMGEKVDIGHI